MNNFHVIHMSSGSEKIVYQGKIIEVVEKPTLVSSGKIVVFESARRSPGTRIIISKQGNILLSREFRTELNGYDYRLPGGKVFDTLNEYNTFLNSSGNVEEKARAAIIKEALEEVGVAVKEVDLVGVSKCGATIEWDLFYFAAKDFSETERRDSGEGEDITAEWVTVEEAKKMCLDGRIQEDRSAIMLLRFLSR